MNEWGYWRHPPRPSVLNARHYAWLAGMIALLTFYGSIIPLRYREQSLDEALQRFTNPTLFAPDNAEARGDWIVSVVLYAVLSFLILGALAVDRPRRRGLECAFLVFAGCALLGVFIEFVQVYFPPRSVSWNDIVVESFGSACGVGLWLASGQQVSEWFRRLWSARGLHTLARLALPGYLLLLFAVHWMPFDFVIRRAELLQKFDGNQVELLPFASLGQGLVLFIVKTGVNVLCFLPLGFLSVLAVTKDSRLRSWVVLLPMGLGIATVIEVGQFFVYSRSCDTTDLVTGTAAVALGRMLGVWIELLWERHGSTLGHGSHPRVDRVLWLVAPLIYLVWLGLVTTIEWYPFNFTTDPSAFQTEEEELPEYGLRRMSCFPLVDYYWNSKYNTLDQFTKKSAAFAPFGILAALLPLARHGWTVGLGAIGAALLIGFVVEGGQYYLPTHHASITDLLLGGGGAAVGYFVTRHLQGTLRPEAGFPGKRP